ncbi:MAG: hypothetical protein Q9179_003287 [Wetmoreana sp. 5 TL-2023]
MSYTLQTEPQRTSSASSQAGNTATIHLRAEEVKESHDLPPSIFPCLDARPGGSRIWQATEVPFRDIDRIRAFASQYQVSSLSILQAAWALVIGRYIGNPSVCFACGSSVIAAYDAEISLSDTVDSVCEVDVDGEALVIDLVKGLKTRVYHARSQPLTSSLLSHQHSQCPVELPANTCLLFRDEKDRNWLDNGESAATNWDGDGSVNAQVVVNISLAKNDFFATVEYLPSTLSVISAPNVASVFAKAIQEILKGPGYTLKDVDLLTSRDLEQLHMWNKPFPQKVDSCVHDIVLEHAKKSPQAPALCSWDGDLTFQELEELSARLAKDLFSAGVRPETLIPVCFKKSLYAVVAMLAILRAGGAFVPLDPSHPRDRLEALIEKASAKIVVASPETAPLFNNIPVTIVKVSSSMLACSEAVRDCRLPLVRPDHAAFVLFTSGSTGKPKGIVQEHASVCTSSLAHGRAMHVTSSSRVFQYAAFTFDVSMMDIFTTLIHGGCVCIPSEEDRMGSFTSAMNRMRVNWVLFTPSVASLIVPEDIPTLRTVAYGGEAVKQENVSRWVGKVRLFNCYGPAECGACAIGEFTRPDARPANVGRHFGGELCWVVDADNHDRLLPIGAVGELTVEGPTLARGYLDDLAKTQAAFIKGPEWPSATGTKRPRRIYKTGDLVRQNSDGTFDYVGRKDLQVKVRGQRVEIGEVEHHLSTWRGTAASLVTKPQSGPYAQALVAVVQLVLPADLAQTLDQKLDHLPNEHVLAIGFDQRKLLDFLKTKLPNYMVPTHILVVTRLPLPIELNNCKPSKTLLPKDDSIGREICSKVLSMVSEPDSMFFKALDGTDFSFVTMGLDSIKTISLTMFIRQRFGVNVHLDLLLEPKSTIRTVADTIAKALRGYGSLPTKPRVDLMDVFRAYRSKGLANLIKNETASTNVFVTGATGFLGSRILRQLCRRLDVQRVFVHVRSQNAHKALQRVVQSAETAGWWNETFSCKLEAWAGDLEKPKLGLKTDQWKRLCGYGSPKDRVTAIVHNGAKVNWNATFSALEATNVGSTAQLLSAAAESTALSKLVYISGGQQLKVEPDDDNEIAKEVAQSNGYAQTKFLSELIVKDYARTATASLQRISIIKPGYIIGGREDGIAVSHDFIWRITAACMGTRSYNAEDARSWLFVSDVDRVATAVSDSCCADNERTLKSGARVVKILDGLSVSSFWDIVGHEVGCEIRPVNPEVWAKRLYADIDARGESHPLWPLLQTIEEGRGRIGAPSTPAQVAGGDNRRIRDAIRTNLEYLTSTGFLHRPKEVRNIRPETGMLDLDRIPPGIKV